MPVKSKVIEVQDKNASLPLSECFNMPTDAKLIIQAYGSELQGKLKVGDVKWLDKMIIIRNSLNHQRPTIDPQWIDYMQNEVIPIVTNGKESLGL